MPRACLQTVDVLSDEALVEARSRLNPAAGVMLQRGVGADTGQLALIIHHLAVDGVSWRVLLEDLNIAWAQHHSGQPMALPAGGTSFARWASLLASTRTPPGGRGARREAWRQVAATPAALPAVRPAVDTYASAGQLSVSLDVETTRMLLGEVPAAFHAGVNDILLIAFGLAWRSFWAPAARRSASTSRATAATRSWPPTWTCRARWAGLPPNTRWRWPSVGWPGRRCWPARRRWGR